jgi:hypothetical protein
MRSQLVRLRTRRLGLMATFLLVLAGAAGIGFAAHVFGAAGSTAPDRLHRQVGVMEGIIDKVLLDSPNFVVSGRDDTRGVILPDYGIVFSFNASINDHDIFRLPGNLSLDLPIDIRTDADGTVIIGKKGRVYSDDSSDLTDEEAAKLEQKAKHLEQEVKRSEKQALDLQERLKDRQQSLTEWNKQRAAKAEELYAAGKQELLQMLLDYGETMTGLQDGQWIVLAGFFDRGGILEDTKASRLVLRVKVDDLRAYSAGRLGETEARGRIIVEEY